MQTTESTLELILASIDEAKQLPAYIEANQIIEEIYGISNGDTQGAQAEITDTTTSGKASSGE